MMYNRTNFVSKGFATRLLATMREALECGYHCYVMNANKERWLRVAIFREDNGRHSFQFIARNGQEVGSQILQGLFSWDHADEVEFVSLVARLYAMKEHPLIVASRKEREALVDRAMATDIGATHKVYTKGGHFLGYARYERRARSLWRRKAYLLTAGERILEEPKEIREEAVYGRLEAL